ncbi:hypothetical protein K443DRAFT_652824, partial [Laccaria amethystina LaAM-08-1]
RVRPWSVLLYLTTCVTCLVLAFTRSWALTLVILSAVPILMLIRGISQGLASPLLASERQQSAIVANIIDRAVSAISTLKAFKPGTLRAFSRGCGFSPARQSCGEA